MLIVALIGYILSFFSITLSRILLYNTENHPMVEKFDCIYGTLNSGEKIPYCQRPDGNYALIRNQTKCENEGKERYFRDLLNRNVEPNEVLEWNSSVEMADFYASIYYNRSFIEEIEDRFVCQCIKLDTFGKYCEYQLTHQKSEFSEAITAQYDDKKTADSWNTQRYGSILCYKTLLCPSSPLCLDWREICDGVQRCSNGIDEENCDKLEFNECEDNEFRCRNGMCIAKEFWFDGERDCMDWSDEYLFSYGEHCPFTPNTIDCDEHLCSTFRYSCGDGECVQWITRMAFQRLAEAKDDCFSKRNLNYMCEVSRHRRAWTLKNGVCSSDVDYDDPRYPPWNMINVSNLTNNEKCEYLFRCLMSDNLERDCPCRYLNCTQMMIEVCLRDDHFILYPPSGLINDNVLIRYNYFEYTRNTNFHDFKLTNSVKCQGYLSQTQALLSYSIDLSGVSNPLINQYLCFIRTNNVHRNFSSRFQNDKFCWNESFTFNGQPYAVIPHLCTISGQCISQYRIHDSSTDCTTGEDEKIVLKNSSCTGNVGRQRFQCYDDHHKCLTSEKLGTGTAQCSNSYDESWFGSGPNLREDLPCWNRLTAGCHRVKDYIRQSSDRSLARNDLANHLQLQTPTDRIPFQSFCNSFWDSVTHWDELPSSCKHWICPSDQYRCQTGQCIMLEWLCDGEWDCTDASDEEAVFLIPQWSPHNARLSGLSARFGKCRQRYSQSPFFKICNTSFEFGCFRSQVSNPLDIKLYRPCINLSQIGDNVEDCYNAYDEKNTFIANSLRGGMWGFHFHCRDGHKEYGHSCSKEKTDNCTDILCSKYRDANGACSGINDVICLDDHQCKKNARCNGKIECLPHGEDEYWCAPGSFINQNRYRFDKLTVLLRPIIFLPLVSYPNQPIMNTDEQQLSKSIIHLSFDQQVTNYSFVCNRGITILQSHHIRCFCPPSYYGDRCQFFSDRLTVIAHLNRTNLPLFISNTTLKMQTNFLFDNTILDWHEFDLVPTRETSEIIKHKFYILYSRSSNMLEHKQKRYFNRTDITTHHPYSVRFLLFALHQHGRPEQLGIWYYPVYFDYLPAFRLSVVLNFPFSFQHPQPSNHCNEHSVSLPNLNQNNSLSCSCESGYYGVNCSLYESLCHTYCAPNAFCQPKKGTQPHCVCPLGYFGTRCHLKYDRCDQYSCLNNGTCHPSYDPSGEQPSICICSKRFHGSRCEDEKASVRVRLNMTDRLAPRATVVQLYDIFSTFWVFQIKYQKVYEGLPSVITSYHSSGQAPPLGLIKTYQDSSDPHYFVMYVLNQVVINITSFPQHCPHVSSLLFTDADESVPMVFHYRRICQNDLQPFCFYDDNYLCFCESDDHRAECFIHNTELDHCDRCLAGGKCLQGDPTDASDFLCLCPSCYQGHGCQFNLQAFGFTFDSLLVRFRKSTKIAYFSVVVLLVILGLFNNSCSFITFKRSTPRSFGTGTYLLFVTCLSQLALFCLLIKFIQITFEISSLVLCQLISYLLSVFTRSTYWLTSWVTVDRILIIFYPHASLLKNGYLAIRLSAVTLVILLGMHIHEVIFYTIIHDHRTNLDSCVVDLGTGFVSVYNRVSTPVHYILPFLIQIISITLLIVFLTRSRMRFTNQKSTFYETLRAQFRNQKELYIMPTLVIFSITPQVIVTFSLACKDLTDVQQHVLACVYLLSYGPQVVGFILYVLPSSSFRKEFDDTWIGKKLFKSMFKKETMKTVVTKTKKNQILK